MGTEAVMTVWMKDAAAMAGLLLFMVSAFALAAMAQAAVA